jgi:hypothetical protein
LEKLGRGFKNSWDPMKMETQYIRTSGNFPIRINNIAGMPILKKSKKSQINNL